MLLPDGAVHLGGVVVESDEMEVDILRKIAMPRVDVLLYDIRDVRPICQERCTAVAAIVQSTRELCDARQAG